MPPELGLQLVAPAVGSVLRRDHDSRQASPPGCYQLSQWPMSGYLLYVITSTPGMGRPEDSAASPGGAETLCHQVISRAPSAGTWVTLSVRELLTGPKRFTEPRTALPGISPKTLSARLQRFVHTGLVTRTAYPEIPPRVEYQLTPAGARLEVVLATVAACAKQDLPRIG